MTHHTFRRWLTDTLADLEGDIGNRTPISRYAEIVAQAKAFAYSEGLHDLALTLPDTETVKTALQAANQLRRCLVALNPPQQPDFLTVNQVVAILGISEKSVRRRVADGTLPPPLKIGRSTRWHRLDIENYRGKYLQAKSCR